MKTQIETKVKKIVKAFGDFSNDVLKDEEQTIEVWDKVSYLSSSSEKKLLTSPELVKLYISKWGISNNIKKIIRNKL